MNEHDFKPGARVRLHSGRDTGTVTRVLNEGRVVEVQWDEDGRRAWRTDALVRHADQKPDDFRGSDDGTGQIIPPR